MISIVLIWIATESLGIQLNAWLSNYGLSIMAERLTTLPRLILCLGGVNPTNFLTKLLLHLINTYRFPLLTAH